MSLKIDISAGDLEWIRPAVLVVSALISTWVLASARKRFSLIVAFLWAVVTFFLTLIVLPLYLIVLLRRGDVQRQTQWKLVPLAYGLVLVGAITIYSYHERHGADSHLAQAAYAKLRGNPQKAIKEYRAALREQDDAHTHKLLANELLTVGYWTEALSEFRLAEQKGESDDLMILRIAGLLDALNQPNQAQLEYRRFLESRMCIQSPPDAACEATRRRIANPQGD